MEIPFDESNQFHDSFEYFTSRRVPTLTDICHLKGTQFVLAHRSAAKFYLIDIDFVGETAALLDTIQLENIDVNYLPDTITIHNSTVYAVNFSNILTKLAIVDGKFTVPEYISIHDPPRIYHGCTSKGGVIYCTQVLGQFTSIQYPFSISMYNTVTGIIEHRTPEHCWNRIKHMGFLGEKYILLLTTSEYSNYADTPIKSQILLAQSSLVLVDAVSWKTLDVFRVPDSQIDCIYIQDNTFYVSAQNAFYGGMMVRGKVMNDAIVETERTTAKAFPHGICLYGDHLLYTSYDTSSLIVQPMNTLDWETYSTQPWKLPVYLKPSRKDLAVILPYFNATKSTRILQNFLTVRELLTCAKIPTFVGEVAFGEEPFQISDGHHFRSKSYGFYKENIVNQVIQSIKENYTKCLVLDADIVFSNVGWYEELSTILDSVDVVHPFQEVMYLGFDFQPRSKLPSIVFHSDRHSTSGHAWAFRIDWWQRVGGLHEHALLGGGDVIFCDQIGLSTQKFISKRVSKYTAFPETRVSFQGQIAYHLPHGSMMNRQYQIRKDKIMKLMNQYGIDSVEGCVEKNADGILECKEYLLDEWNSILYQYFEERRDDGL
jgi:hypothetical protein